MNGALVFAIAQFVLTGLIGLGLWLFATGRYTQKQESGQQSDNVRIKALEDNQVDEHKLRREINRDVGSIDVRLSKAEVRIEDQGRRLGYLERGT